MRFLHFDRVVRLEPGVRIEAVKAVGLSEEFFRGHFTRRAVVPGALVLESMCQAAGWLVMASHAFRVQPFLALVEDVVLPSELGPGRRIDLVATLVTTDPKGSVSTAQAFVDGETIASAGRVLFGHFPNRQPEALRELFHFHGGPA